MNVSERLPGLQRRAGRRKSTPASPSSPIFHRRHGRSQDMPFFSPIDPPSAITPSESPSIDLTVPSPTFDLSAISPALAADSSPALPSQPVSRFPDDWDKNRPALPAENPPSNGAYGGGSAVPTAQIPSQPSSEQGKGSPLSGSQRTSADGPSPRRPLSREQDDGSAQRAAAFWAQYEKSTTEDATLPRHLANSRKSRFNMLNPMSLWVRRRSSQNTHKLDEVNLNVNTLHVPAIPDNITPSIRGTMVHDFSAPRVRRVNNENSPRPGLAPSPNYPRRPSEIMSPPADSTAGTPASLHSPMFREHFQDENRPVQPKNTAYLHSQNLQAPSAGNLPSFAKSLPLQLPPDEDASSQATLDAPIAASQNRFPQAVLPTEPDHSPPPPPPPKKTPSPVQEIPVNHGLPKHMTSTSSRFSFIGQQGSLAQEKVLEDKHKEHASKKPAQVRFSTASMDDMDDYDNYDGYDEDDGFDNGDIAIKNIDIPSSQDLIQQPVSLHTEDDDDFDDEFGTGDIEVKNIDVPTSQMRPKHDENLYGHDNIVKQVIDVPDFAYYGPEAQTFGTNHRQSLQAFHFTPQSLTFSPSTTHHTSQSTPRDGEGFPIGMAQSKEVVPYDFQPRIRDSTDQATESMFYEGLGISTAAQELSIPNQLPFRKEPFDDSDLYFDDGEFGEDVIESTEAFDEDILDDPSQIKDIPAENERKYQAALQRALPGEGSGDITGEAGDVSHMLPKPLFIRTESPEMYFQHRPSDQGILTEGNLAAHHDALALALNKAAANGAFDRSITFSPNSDDGTDSPFHNSLPGISSRGSRYSYNMISSGISDEDCFGLEDDDMDDDAMIAAANAEVLENDDDGFYGQEFGFYARAHGRDSAEFVNGGYFASRGSNGVKRSHSSKNNFQEPSLTPITERSEWSTRESVVSLSLHTGIPGAAQSLPSPGIAQLLKMDSPVADDEMTLSALLKLRGKAFNASSTSINSVAERHLPHGSPLAQVSGYNVLHGDATGGRMSSPILGINSLSIAESEGEGEDGGRHTLTQNTPLKTHKEPTRETSHSSREQEQVPSSPISRRGNHSRNSSGAESVSYARDTDGGWVLERRRTGDDGELELVEREYLAGAQI